MVLKELHEATGDQKPGDKMNIDPARQRLSSDT
jgi:hypothetical protein